MRVRILPSPLQGADLFVFCPFCLYYKDTIIYLINFNKMNNTGLHGKFEKIDKAFMEETFVAFEALESIQKKYGKTDNDTVINEARDAMVAQVLSYDYINTDKHGWDAKDDNDKFLEVKQASATANHICATFNDTTEEKAEELGSENLTIALAVWSSLRSLQFVVYGSNPEIGPFIKNKIIVAKQKGHIRPGTQSISMNDLIFKFGFKIRPVRMSKEEIKTFLSNKSGFKTYLNKEHRELPFDDEA